MARICLVSPFAYGALRGGASGHIGGVERQTTLLARWLAGRNHTVSLVTWDEGQNADECIDGIQVIKMCRRDAGLPGLRFFHPRWTSLVSALSRARAEVYYQNCGEYVTGQVAIWCLRHGARFVYSVASDPDCDPRLPQMRTLRERVLYRYGLRHADRVIVQTSRQRTMLKDGFDRDALVLPMPCPGPPPGAVIPSAFPFSTRPRIVWVGRIAPVKRPEMILEVAAHHPEFTFEIIGGADGSDDLFRALMDRAATLENVTMRGRVSMDQMAGIYPGAAALCCTSAYEGFPNTFLEAWSHGVPVVSTIDPDGLIQGRGLGAVADDAAGLGEALTSLCRDSEFWRETSERARRYFLQYHALDVAMERFEKTLVDVLPGCDSTGGFHA